jgi:polyhydroxyalkanoate synthesis regulator phasin
MALTKKDIDLLSRYFATKTEFNSRLDELEKKLKAEIKFLPTKDDFYIQMDKLMKELSTIREELTLTPSFTQFADLEERVEALEKQIAAV